MNAQTERLFEAIYRTTRTKNVAVSDTPPYNILDLATGSYIGKEFSSPDEAESWASENGYTTVK